MPTNNGMPRAEILFKGLGTSAVKRGERGTAGLILKDSTPGENKLKYKSISDFTSEEQEKFTPENVLFIKDSLEGTPLELYIFKMKKDDIVADTLNKVKGIVPRNCWLAIQSSVSADQDDLISFIKSENKNNKKRYKGIVYKGTNPDYMHIVNQTNEKITFPDERGEVTGENAISYLLGFYAGLPLSMSGIAKPTKFISVQEPEDLDKAIANGEHVLFNDEGIVKVARAVNSLVTLTQGVTIEMTHINTIEKMDFIYTDILKAWNDGYKGKYPNVLDNQMLFISAINGYFKTLSKNYILDPNFANKTGVDIEAQRIANYPKYGEDTVNSWDDAYALKMTVGTSVFLKANIKIAGIMEDLFFDIYM
ncbi:MAG: phage tail sheath C-terminal domain-containing protein [Fusobacteriaceae bacterium]